MPDGIAVDPCSPSTVRQARGSDGSGGVALFLAISAPAPSTCESGAPECMICTSAVVKLSGEATGAMFAST
eukprot:3321236-Pleurochrysis_carterae.AAC.1